MTSCSDYAHGKSLAGVLVDLEGRGEGFLSAECGGGFFFGGVVHQRARV